MKLVGTWKLENDSIFEKWTNIINSFSAVEKKKKNQDTTILENIEIIKENEYLFFQARIVNQNNTESIRFKLSLAKDMYLLFVNKEHDFPRHIRYELLSTDSLQSIIGGTIEGQDKQVYFNYQRQIN